MLYMVRDSFTSLVEGNITGNIDANEELIPPRIRSDEQMKAHTSFWYFLTKNMPINPQIYIIEKMNRRGFSIKLENGLGLIICHIDIEKIVSAISAKFSLIITDLSFSLMDEKA